MRIFVNTPVGSIEILSSKRKFNESPTPQLTIPAHHKGKHEKKYFQPKQRRIPTKAKIFT
ncbi:hypothetical protein AKJ61_00050 [candidate division MSBL1 archaeon SCGC-AAA259B11]|uniref:Uncharacterized protein n=1 Tax=candidate division MSBL1 archaeon SCGC-AAA259B11 TaxID=1698260 RepID=A0A133U920_9EURY|nr:hypothetical protein AKJ61_00050 [candidate division MSBL1 archaeon SCGC-AAA259B11]